MITTELSFIEELLDIEKGYAVIEVEPTDLDSIARYLDKSLSPLFFHIPVFEHAPEWKPIGVDLNVEDYRVGGTGLIPLHMDFVNASLPPDLVLFYCATSDRWGGGESILCPVAPVMRALRPQLLEQILVTFISEGQFFGLANLGRELNPFPLWDGAFFRFTGKKLRMDEDFRERDVLAPVAAVAMDLAVNVPLRRGQALIVNQRLCLHGRRPLSRGLCGEIDEGRLLYQRFYRKSE